MAEDKVQKPKRPDAVKGDPHGKHHSTKAGAGRKDQPQGKHEKK